MNNPCSAFLDPLTRGHDSAGCRALLRCRGPARIPSRGQVGARLPEVLPVLAGPRPNLTLILRPNDSGSVRVRCRRRHLHETHLSDLHARVQGDRQTGDIGQLKSDLPVPTGVDKAGRRVDQQSEPAEARLSFESTHKIIGQRDPFEGGTQHKFAWMQDEWIGVCLLYTSPSPRDS